MAYNKQFASRVRAHMEKLAGYTEKVMFGGVGFMLHGNMVCGVHKDQLIVRVGPEGYEAALEKPFARVFDLTGRSMKGWVFVDPQGFESDSDLKTWIDTALMFAESLPPK